MKVERRKFIKGMFAGLAMAAIPFIPKLPEIPLEPTPPKPVASLFACRDYTFRVTIREYSPGETITYEDLSEGACCDNCLHEPRCITSGKKFEATSLPNGKFVPEWWNKRLQNILYRRISFTGDIT